LPHRLIASFKATLEEARKTDLLLHVCDASNPAVLDQISAVFEVLKELDIEEKDTLLVINKIDAVPNRVAIESVLRRYPRGIPVSARTGEGIDRLKVAVSDALSATFRDIEVETHVANGRLLAYLAAHGEILSQTYDDNQVTIHCRIPQKYVGRIREKETVVRDRTSGERLNYKPPEEWELLRAKAAVRPSDDVAVQAESDAAVETQNEHVVGGEELLREVPPTNAKRSDVARNDDSMGDVA
jgi:GTP-binding protein HflX